MTTEHPCLPPSVVRKWEARVQQYATNSPWSWAIFVVLIAVATSLFSRFPAYTDVHAKFPGNFVGFSATPVGRATQWWLDHPFQPVPIDAIFSTENLRDPLIGGAASHSDKLTFRAFIPLLNQVTGAGIWTLIVANHVAAILSFLLIYHVCLRATRDTVVSSTVVWAFAGTWAGAWGFNDMMFGDAVAISLLLAAMITRSSWLVSLLFIAAGLTDERAFFAAPAVTLYHLWLIHPPPASRIPVFNWAEVKAAATPLVSAFIVYATFRLFANHSLNLHSGTSMMGTPDIMLYHFYVSYPTKLFKVFEFLWAFPLLLLFRLGTSGSENWYDIPAYVVCIAIAMGPGFLIWDLDRSLCYVLPAVLSGVCFWHINPVKRRSIALVICLGSLLWLEPNASLMRYFVFS